MRLDELLTSIDLMLRTTRVHLYTVHVLQPIRLAPAFQLPTVPPLLARAPELDEPTFDLCRCSEGM